MRSEAGWDRYRLGDIADECRYGYTASATDRQQGPRFLRITDIVGDLAWESVPFVEASEREIERYKLQDGDIVIGRTGANVGVSAHIMNPPNAVFASYLVRFRFDRAKVSDRFIGYVLKSPMWAGYVQGAHTGSGQPQLNATIMKDFEFPMPSLEEQRRIAWVLGSLDAKIESNRRLARTLEEIATALFKARFVDFVGHDDLVKSKIGAIPRGWKATPASAIARYINGRAFTKFGNDSGRMVIRIAELRSGPGAATVYTDHETTADHIANPGDLLFAWSGSLDIYRWYRPGALINQHIFKVIPQGYPAWFVFHVLSHVMPSFQAIAADKATTMGHIKRSHLDEIAIAAPPADELRRHDSVFTPIFERTLKAKLEIETTQVIRSRLLPKLISGEIRVPTDAQPDAEAG